MGPFRVPRRSSSEQETPCARPGVDQRYRPSVNPRRIVVEDRALSLADAIERESPVWAARLREVVPETFGLCDEHVPALRQVLDDVARSASRHSGAAVRILAALDDLPAHIGRRGRVWIGEDGSRETYRAHWTDEDWLEEGPEGASLDAVLAWARRRTDDIWMPHDE
jgi:hypothetical protein